MTGVFCSSDAGAPVSRGAGKEVYPAAASTPIAAMNAPFSTGGAVACRGRRPAAPDDALRGAEDRAVPVAVVRCCAHAQHANALQATGWQQPWSLVAAIVSSAVVRLESRGKHTQTATLKPFLASNTHLDGD